MSRSPQAPLPAPPTAGPGLATALRLALRDLRGGIRGFRVMIACLALGVAAIAAIGSFTAAVHEGLERDAQALLGGDLDLRLTHREASSAQLAWLEDRGRVSHVARMRSMARDASGAGGGEDGTDRALVELKAVDAAYPLYGRLEIRPEMPLARALAPGPDGAFSALVERGLLSRLGIEVGGAFTIGDARFRVRALLLREPDQASGRFKLGPRVIVSDRALVATGLVRPGSLIRHHYRLALPAGSDADAVEGDLRNAFPDAGWRVRNVQDAIPRLQRHANRAALFFTLVGLAALLVGGIGVAGAVTGYLEGKRDSIATLKCLGATGGFVFLVFGIEVGIIATAGIVLGLAAGAALPALAGPMIADVLPVVPRVNFFPVPLIVAAAYGVAVAVLFALWPLARARDVSAASLFRGIVATGRFRPGANVWAGLALALAVIAGLALASAFRPRFAIWFIVGALIAFPLFHLLGRGVAALAAVIARRLAEGSRRWPRLGLALANIHRPGAPAQAIILAFGVGLTIFVALVEVEGNLRRQITEHIPADAPAYFFIDIQPGQLAGFESTVADIPGTGRIKHLPSMRGRIVRVDGRPLSEVDIGPGARWAVRGDRGLTFTDSAPENAHIVDGEWWPADYRGPPLVSLDARIARGLGLDVGDTLTVNVLGRNITARVANLRRINWSALDLNFTMIFAPGALEGAPHTYIATVRASIAAEDAVVRAVTDRFENVTAISVREAIAGIVGVLDSIAAAARATAGLALVSGILVLAGAVAAGLRERTRDAVILKVTGARRRDLAIAYLIEYGIAGLAAGLVAVALGTAGAFFILTRIMDAGWVFLPAPAAATVAIATVAVVLLGFAGTWRALAQRPAPVLRRY